MVWKLLVQCPGDYAAVTEALGVSVNTQKSIVERFLTEGTVETHQGQGASRPQRVFDADADIWLLGNVIDDPEAKLCERAASFMLATGTVVHISTICRALRRIRLSRTKVHSAAHTACLCPLLMCGGRAC